ncbi:hypothetical protein [Paenibacillus montaniterrae]|nr:hypothetical protein [Paenibacillus montaniterrae]
MKCEQCGQLMQEGQMICERCSNQAADSAQQDNPTSYRSAEQESAAGLAANSAKAASKAQPIIQYAKDYGAYALNIMKSPYQHAFAAKRENLAFGLVTIIALAILFGLANVSFVSSFVNRSVLGLFQVQVSFFSMFLRPALGMLVYAALSGCLIYGVLYIHKLRKPFTEVLAQWFAYMVLPAAIALVLLLVSLLNLIALYSVLVLAMYLSILAAAAAMLQQYKVGQQGGKSFLDPYYTLTLTYILLLLGIYSLGKEWLASLINF